MFLKIEVKIISLSESLNKNIKLAKATKIEVLENPIIFIYYIFQV